MQKYQVLQMIGMTPKERQEYLRITAAARQSMSQSELFQLQRVIPKSEC